LKSTLNILFFLLLLAFGLNIFQYIPVLKKTIIKSELVKKAVTDAEEKDSEDEKQESQNINDFLVDFTKRYTLQLTPKLSCIAGNYLSAIKQNSTPPPEQA
jgi:hypothetical protein